MKAQSASMTLYDVAPGHHRESLEWHDADHKAEVVGRMPTVFISQRWVTPPEWLPLRASTSIPAGGGQYVNLYWTTGPVADLDRDFSRLGSELAAVGRMETATKYMKRVWPANSPSLIPLTLQTRPGLALSGQAMVASTAMTGLMVVLDEVREPSQRASYEAWHTNEYLPMALQTGLFAGVAKLAAAEPSSVATYVSLYYLDTADPSDAYLAFDNEVDQWRGSGKLAAEKESSHHRLFQTIAQPSIGHYDIYE